jgi:hypothetical protein
MFLIRGCLQLESVSNSEKEKQEKMSLLFLGDVWQKLMFPKLGVDWIYAKWYNFRKREIGKWETIWKSHLKQTI